MLRCSAPLWVGVVMVSTNMTVLCTFGDIVIMVFF